MKLNEILGINSRSADYLSLNKKQARHRADDKLMTKRLLSKHNVPHPRLLGVIGNSSEVKDFDWMKLESFVIKPVKGYGGEGVMIVRRKSKTLGFFILVDGRKIGVEDLRLHCLDIIEGRYSHNNLPDKAMIEERIRMHPKFKRLSVGGAPDVRVIVFNKVPVMAMLRLATEESGGKANLHQGAVGLGIDMATGITTHGVYKNEQIKFLPETDKKVNGISIPSWGKIMRMAVQTQVASRLSYLSVDLLIDEEKGPLVLELNDQPGLSIQLANMAGLKRRLERVEGLEVEDAEKGVKITRALFANRFGSKTKVDTEEKKIVGVFETVKIKIDKKRRIEVPAKIDSGARSTSIDRKLAEELGLLNQANILWTKKVKSSLGNEDRPVIQIVFWLKGVKMVTRANVTDRQGLRRGMLIGRRDLRDFLLDPSLVKLKVKKK